MPIIGKIIKSAVEVADKIFTNNNPKEAQEAVLKDLLSKAKKTAFGKYYQFEQLLDSDDIRDAYASEVPFFSYDQLLEVWWRKVIDGAEDITWPGKVNFFGVVISSPFAMVISRLVNC